MNLSKDQVLKKIAKVPHWYHQIEVMPGVVTPGINNTDICREWFDFPKDCHGMRVLDLGARDGYYSFLFEKRGAEVVALDYVAPEDTGFPVAAELLGSKVKHHQDNIYNVTAEKYGHFDVVLMLGLLYHLPDPMLALSICRKVCCGKLFLETRCIDLSFLMPDGQFVPLRSLNEQLPGIPLMQFYPKNSLNADYTNYWAPNMACMEAMLVENDFKVVRKDLYGDRAAFQCEVGGSEESQFFDEISRGLVKSRVL